MVTTTKTFTRLLLVTLVALILAGVTGAPASAQPEVNDGQCVEAAGDWERAQDADGFGDTVSGAVGTVINGVQCMAPTGVLGPVGDAVGVANDVEDVVEWKDGAFVEFVRNIKDGNPAVIGFTMSLWTKFKLDADSLQLRADGINNIVWQAAIVGLALSMLIGFMKIMASRNEGSSESLTGAAKGYGKYLFLGILVPLLAVPSLAAFDSLANHWINTYVTENGDFTKLTDAATIGEELHPLVIFLLVGLSALGSAAMCLMMIIRVIALPVLIGLLPIFAAWAIGNSGKSAADNAFGVTLSFILLTPVAALVYSSGVWVALNLDGTEENKVISIMIFGSMGLVGPGIFALILPALRGQAGGGGGALGGALMGATGAILGGAAGGAGLAMAGAGAASSAMGSASNSAASSSPDGATGAVNAQTTSPGVTSTGGEGPTGSNPSTGGPGGPTGGNGPTGSSPSTGGTGGAGSPTPGSGVNPKYGGNGAAGPSTGGARPAGSGSATAARILSNAGGTAAQTLSNTQGVLDQAVGAPTHPQR